jgi:enoyl-CoA hydratase
MTGVRYERRESIAIIYLNRSGKHNNLFPEGLNAISESLERIREIPEIRVVILTGVSDSFSGQSDTSELAQVNEDQAAPPALTKTVCKQIENYHVPVIAEVNGAAAGSGCELVLASHLLIAAKNSRFSLAEIGDDLSPVHEDTTLSSFENARKSALDMMLWRGPISAEQAVQVGLVNRLVEPEDVMTEAESLANEIVNLAPGAIRACLEAVNHGADLSLENGLALESKLFASLFATDDVREGTQAFLEKRKPMFKGT